MQTSIVEHLSSTVYALRIHPIHHVPARADRVPGSKQLGQLLYSEAKADRVLVLFLLVIFALLFIVISETNAQAPLGSAPKEAESAQSQRVFAALELAKLAAEANQPEVSFEAVRRVASTGPVIGKVDLGGLLSSPQQSGSISISSNARAATPQQQAASRVAAKMIEVNDLWQKMAFDPAVAYSVWLEHIFPPKSPNVINLHSKTSAAPNQLSISTFSLQGNSTKPPQKCGAQCFIDWASKAEKIDLIEQELNKRLSQPGNAELGWLFKIWIADSKSAASEVYESILAEIEPKLSTQIIGNASELKTHAIREALKKLPAESELKSRFMKSFLKALPTTSNWNGNPDNMDLLRECILRAIAADDTDSGETIAEAVASLWSSIRTGNESAAGRMESQAYMALATAAFEKKAFKIGGQWIQRVEFNANYLQQGTNWFHLRSETTQHLLKCPQDVRFELFSKQLWTAPMLGLIDMSCLMPEFHTPEIHRGKSNPPLLKLANPNATSLSAMEWLMRDAIALGRQLEIEKKIAGLTNSKSDDKAIAELLWDKARDQSIDIKRLVKTGVPAGDDSKETTSIQRLRSEDGPPMPIELEIAELAIRDPATRELGVDFTTRLLDACVKNKKTTLLSKCRYLLYTAAKSSRKPPITQEKLKHFVEASDWDGGAVLDGAPPNPVWVSRNESHTSWGHEFSTMQSYLFLKYPLSGDFKIDFKARDGSHAEPGITMGGILAEFCPYNKTVLLRSLGYRHMGSATKSFDKYHQKEWNQYRVIRTSKDFQIYINGETAVTIPQAESVTPFFGLGSSSFRSSTFDELKITGKVEIPRGVDLCTPRLAGWSSYYTQQMLEPIQLMTNHKRSADESGYSEDAVFGQSQGYDFESAQTQEFPLWTGRLNGDVAYPWFSKEGMLESVDQRVARDARLAEAATANGGTVAPQLREILEKEPAKPRSIGMIYYQRPLCNGESIDLEFYQDSQPAPIEGKLRSLPLLISPTIGRVAILLDQPTVSLRWIPADGEKEWLGTESEQRVIDPEARQLSRAEIKERDWNTMTVRWNEGVATLSINGQDVYQRKWETSLAPQFGFYHNPNESQIRVRNVRLKGNWPNSLPDNLFETF